MVMKTISMQACDPARTKVANAVFRAITRKARLVRLRTANPEKCNHGTQFLLKRMAISFPNIYLVEVDIDIVLAVVIHERNPVLRQFSVIQGNTHYPR